MGHGTAVGPVVWFQTITTQGGSQDLGVVETVLLADRPVGLVGSGAPGVDRPHDEQRPLSRSSRLGRRRPRRDAAGTPRPQLGRAPAGAAGRADRRPDPRGIPAHPAVPAEVHRDRGPQPCRLPRRLRARGRGDGIPRGSGQRAPAALPQGTEGSAREPGEHVCPRRPRRAGTGRLGRRLRHLRRRHRHRHRRRGAGLALAAVPRELAGAARSASSPATVCAGRTTPEGAWAVSRRRAWAPGCAGSAGWWTRHAPRTPHRRR